MRSAGSSWALLCSTALLLVLFTSASEELPRRQSILQQEADMTEFDPMDMDLLQRPVDMFDIFHEGFGQELPRPQSPMQQEVDLTDILSPNGDSRPVLTPRGSRPGFSPRSFFQPIPPIPSYPVQFPHGRPTSENIQAVCLNGDHRPRYPQSYFPSSGFSKQRRKATAVNNAEAWFITCCKGNQTWATDALLCCATQAWELSVDLFCEEDSSVKDIQYHCCEKRGHERQTCFTKDAPNPSYEPTEELPVTPLPSTNNFDFDPSTCMRTVMTQYRARTNRRKVVKKLAANKKIDINFPLGQPTEDNIEPLCHMQKLRPLYNTKCVPRSGYELLAHQAKSINRLEKGLKQCCKKKQGVLNCAEQKWREEIDKFCSTVNAGQMDFQCCSGDVTPDRYTCFKLNSPDPHYNMTSLATSATEELSLTKLCDTHNIIKKRFPVGFPLKTFVSQCCPLPEQEKASCSMQQMQEISQNVCSSKQKAPPAVRRCCKMASKEEIPQCFSKIVRDAITKATNASRQKKRKRCPLS
ncbi:extracellular matrix protein 1-like [Cololabis saira]|uniref:extracellular matrix protein 1-like n=1 Tax=Cololabis saira TaxID=129043 RepID=UPI002AD33BE4|nr:extracellular matrix protein 1-like [Cololabis saira]